MEGGNPFVVRSVTGDLNSSRSLANSTLNHTLLKPSRPYTFLCDARLLKPLSPHQIAQFDKLCILRTIIPTNPICLMYIRDEVWRMQREVREMAKDLVCGMEVDPKTAPAKAEYEGKTYYFCAPGCKRAFEEQPEKYLREAEGDED